MTGPAQWFRQLVDEAIDTASLEQAPAPGTPGFPIIDRSALVRCLWAVLAGRISQRRTEP